MNLVTLIVLAAGLGSRFGGPKQFFNLGPNDECLYHYSVFSAKRIGVKNLILVTRQEIYEQASQSAMSLPLDSQIVLQSTPGGKPRGTADALLEAMRSSSDNQFIVINADDYYGPETFELSAKLLSFNPVASAVPYSLKQTLSPHGGVSRAICEIQNDLLTGIHETHDLVKTGDCVTGMQNGLKIEVSVESPVSMNFFTFSKSLQPNLEIFVENFSTDQEITIPDFLNLMIKSEHLEVPVKVSHSLWFGMTYADDLNEVRPRLQSLHQNNVFPRQLW